MKAFVAVAISALLSACTGLPLPQATLEQDHPLVGKIWQPETQSFVSVLSARKIMIHANYVLMGEKHDNSVHHQLQAKAVRDLIQAHVRPVIAFEMINTDQSAALDKFVATHPADANNLGAAIDWQKTGWPDWRYYAPIADAALKSFLLILPANYARAKIREIGRDGYQALDQPFVHHTKLNQPLPKTLDNSLMDEMFTSHCQMMPRKHLRAVARVQRARDALMAYLMANDEQVVLIAGAGHTRKDRGVPYYLRRMEPYRKIVSVAYIEVEKSITEPGDYAQIYHAEKLPFDLVWFTPRVDNIDPCEKFKKQLQNMKKKSG